MSKQAVIAIDGPAGAGKSTVAQEVADELGFVRVDTGALYRAVALAAKEHGISWDDGEAVGELANGLPLAFVASPSGPRLTIDERDRDDDLRTTDIAEGASIVSKHPSVRAALLEVQRAFAERGGVVLEGRDIGTVVYPEADVKVFLTASAEARTDRRLADLHSRGIEANRDELLAAIEQRDARDAGRDIAPLRPAEGAVVIDSTEMTRDAVVSRIVRLAR